MKGMKTTELGKELRILRIERGELLYDMATALGFSSSYLSAIETGKRAASDSFIKKLQEIYCLPEERINKIKEFAEQSVSSVSMQLAEVSKEQKELAIAFAKKFDNLDSQTIQKIQRLIGGNICK